MESNKIKNNPTKFKRTKIITSMVALILIFWLAATYYSGTVLEKNRAQLTNNLALFEKNLTDYLKKSELLDPQEMLPKLDLRYISYHRGFFSSQIEIGLYNEVLFGQEPVIFNVDLYHGPLPLNRLEKLQLTPKLFSSHITLQQTEITTALYQIAQQAEPLNVIFERSYSDDWRLILQTPLLKYTKESDEYALEGLKIISELNQLDLSAKINLNALSYSHLGIQQKNTLNLKQLKLDYKIADLLDKQQQQLHTTVDHFSANFNGNSIALDQLKLDLNQKDQIEYQAASSIMIKKLSMNIFNQSFSTDEILLDDKIAKKQLQHEYTNHIELKNMSVNTAPFGSVKWILKGEVNPKNTEHIDYANLKELFNDGKIAELSYLLIKTKPKLENLIIWENNSGQSTLNSHYIFDATELTGIETDNNLDYIEPIDIIVAALQQAEANLSIDKNMLQEFNANFKQDNVKSDNSPISEQQFTLAINILNQYFGSDLLPINTQATMVNPSLNQAANIDESNTEAPIEIFVNQTDKITSHVLFKDGIFTINNSDYRLAY